MFFAGVDWIAVVVGALAAFLAGWFWYSPKGFYPGWSEAAGVRHQKGDPMGASFGALVVGLILLSIFVGVMMARGMLGSLTLGTAAFIVMGYSGNAFKKNGAYARSVDAGSWALSVVLMVIAQMIF